MLIALLVASREPARALRCWRCLPVASIAADDEDDTPLPLPLPLPLSLSLSLAALPPLFVVLVLSAPSLFAGLVLFFILRAKPAATAIVRERFLLAWFSRLNASAFSSFRACASCSAVHRIPVGKKQGDAEKTQREREREREREGGTPDHCEC